MVQRLYFVMDRSVLDVCAKAKTVTASEAKQSMGPQKESMDCFVAEFITGRPKAGPVGASQ